MNLLDDSTSKGVVQPHLRGGTIFRKVERNKGENRGERFFEGLLGVIDGFFKLGGASKGLFRELNLRCFLPCFTGGGGRMGGVIANRKIGSAFGKKGDEGLEEGLEVGGDKLIDGFHQFFFDISFGVFGAV